MSKTSRFCGRVGLDSDFFEPVKIAHFALEAPIGKVSEAMEHAGRFVSLKDPKTLRIERDTFGKECGGQRPIGMLFQLKGQNWTQIAVDIGKFRGLELGRWLSLELNTRCICIEVTDDAYQSHALFENGITEELYLFTMNVDMNRSLSRLDVEVPAEFRDLDPDDFSTLDEAEYSYSRSGSLSRGAAELATRAGCYLCTPTFGDSGHGVSGVQAAEQIRIDAIWLDI